MTGSGPRSPRSPVPDEVATELQRVVERWRQLPLDHALSYSGQVRAFVQRLADQVAAADSTVGSGRDGSVGGPEVAVTESVVPDLGPATLMDQLTVLVYDASAAAAAASVPVTSTSGPSSAVTTASAVTSTLATELARLRSELR